MIYIHLKAPFGVFRTMATGSFRPTADFITFSAAYGLLLNFAGIEMREYDNNLPMTIIKENLPRFKIAIGAVEYPKVHKVYQQLHNYPVGPAGQERAEDTKGCKYNIAPVWRAFLSDIDAWLAIQCNDDFKDKLLKGIKGESQRQYGLPFLGDNNFLIDRFELHEKVEPVYWFRRVNKNTGEGLEDRITRLTITIDREDMTNTKSDLFAPTNEKTTEIPDDSWVDVGY